jgi:hypothetical protein
MQEMQASRNPPTIDAALFQEEDPTFQVRMVL